MNDDSLFKWGVQMGRVVFVAYFNMKIQHLPRKTKKEIKMYI